MNDTKQPTIIPVPLGHGRYRVESRSGGKGHDVDVRAGRCSCPAPNGTCWAYKLCRDAEDRRGPTLEAGWAYIRAHRRQRIKSVDLDTCQTCRSRPAAAGSAECSPCLMAQLQAAFGCAS